MAILGVIRSVKPMVTSMTTRHTAIVIATRCLRSTVDPLYEAESKNVSSTNASFVLLVRLVRVMCPQTFRAEGGRVRSVNDPE